MRAVWYDRQGAADDVLVCGELPPPEAGHGEVRVRLEASGVNPSDTYRRRGPPAMEYPRVVTNSDGAGVVDQVGPGVPERWLGERVWLYNGQRNGRWQGTAAEYIALSVDLVTELPDYPSLRARPWGYRAWPRTAPFSSRGRFRARRCSSPAAPERSVIKRCSSPPGPGRG